MGEVTATIRAYVDGDSLAFLAEMRARLSALADLAEKPADLVDLVRRLPRGPGAIDVQRLPAGGTGEHRIVFEFAQPWRELMAELRAFQGCEARHD